VYDAIVVGARCAGASTALLLARQGLRVLAVDRSAYGSDTLSTLALMRGGAIQLQRWGVLDAVKRAGTPPIRLTVFHYGDEQVDVPIKPRDGIDALYAPRRTVLDRLLVDAAVEAGAHVVHGPRLIELSRSVEGRVRGVVLQDRDGTTREVRSDIVIGADGQQSTVARLVGATAYRTGAHATGVVYGFWRGLTLPGYQWYYRPGAGIGSIQTNDDLTCLFVATPATRFMEEIRHDLSAGYHRVMADTAMDLATRLRTCELVGPLRGFPGQAGYFRQSWGPGWALVGDAGYFKDPFTAHGITDALRDAEFLAQAIGAGTDTALAEYQSRRDELSRELFTVTDRIASFEWDLPTVRDWHKLLSKEMQREAAALTDLAPPASVAIAGSDHV
jgi:2-polyprenyl-6-methoxyphenol hydroxylase-like FAD-dependent oxidoreductase